MTRPNQCMDDYLYTGTWKNLYFTSGAIVQIFQIYTLHKIS